MTENWYIILGLELDPPIHDEKIIRNRINEEKRKWTNDLNKKKYLKQLQTIEKDMIGEHNIRDELIEDACKKVYGPIDEILEMFKETNEIPQETIVKLAEDKKVDVEFVKRRAAALGFKIGADYQELYKKYYETEPQKPTNYNDVKRYLDRLQSNDLYEFLGLSDEDPQDFSCDELVRLADEKKKKEFYKTDDRSSDGERLCGHCKDYFRDDSSRQIYDDYLAYRKRKEILDKVQERSKYKPLTQDNCRDYADQLEKIFKNREDAANLLKAFCQIKEIPLPSFDTASERKTRGQKASEQETREEKAPDIKLCRWCRHRNDISDGRKTCENCGSELWIKCPNCGILNDANIAVCQCGFEYANLDRAMQLCNAAESALQRWDFRTAEATLNEAWRYWPGSEKVSELSVRLEALKRQAEAERQAKAERQAEAERQKAILSQVGEAANRIQEACRGKRYYDAYGQLERLKEFAPGFSEPVLEREIANAISTAEKYREIAKSASNEAEIVEACIKAYEASDDCPEVREILSKYPPAAPVNLEISTNKAAKANVLSWTDSPALGVSSYIVVRKEGSVPAGVQDGVFVRIGRCGFEDRDISPGIEYFYAVFAERAGACSKPLTNNKAAMLKRPTRAIHVWVFLICMFAVGPTILKPVDTFVGVLMTLVFRNASAEVIQIAQFGRMAISALLVILLGIIVGKLVKWIIR